MATRKEFYVVIEKDEDGFYVGEVPQRRACYTQGRPLDERMESIKEVSKLSLEEEKAQLCSAGRDAGSACSDSKLC